MFFQEGKGKSKKKGETDDMNSDPDIDMEDESTKKDDVYDVGDFPIYTEDPDSETEEQAVLEAGEIVKKFTNRYDKSYESCVKRRAKVSE